MSETCRTLGDLADACEQEAQRAWISDRKRWKLRDTASLYRRMRSNRAAADPDKLTLNLWLHIDVTERWCRQHGYRPVVGTDGMAIQRGDEPALLVKPGDTLRWDGERLNAEREGAP